MNFRPSRLASLVFICAAVSAAQTNGAKLDANSFQPNRQKAVQTNAKTGYLRQLNESLEELAHNVSPAVVEIQVTGYGPVSEGGNSSLIGRQRSLGSGVVVAPDGYIITNAHVIEGARRIQVVQTTQEGQTAAGMPSGIKHEYEAKIIGVHKETDLALLKVDAAQMPFLPLSPHHPVRQGELVIALGSPEGLGNSVTMGIISAVNRQPDPDLPMVYIQTDAPINHGNSGGPLVDAEGYLVGINTFILSQGGGSEGLGFAIPVAVVNFVYERLRKFGHVDRSEIGAVAESITPLLAEGLQLAQKSGVIVSDVLPGGPAENAGLHVGDIVLSVDGRLINSVAMLDASAYLHPTDELMTMEVLRGKDKLTLHIPVVARKHNLDRLSDLVDPEKNLIPKLGILGVELNAKSEQLVPELRLSSGVIVVARAAYGGSVETDLRPGDVIHSINNKPVVTLEELRAHLRELKPSQAVVLQIERGGSMGFIKFEFE